LAPTGLIANLWHRTTDGVSPERVEEILLLCTAPPEQIAYDGWLVRRNRHDAKRASSVNAFYASTKPLAEKIAQCEKLYADYELPPIFRLTPFSHPANLDVTLAQHGYERFEPNLVQVSRLNRPFPSPPDGLRFETMLLERWLEISARMRVLPELTVEAEFERLHHCEAPGYCVIGYSNEEAVACGIVMHEAEFAGLFDIFVSETHRGRGFGTAISAHLLDTARRMGAEIGWLSVVKDNAPALRVYEKLGFETLYEYWYRVKP
jgi:N-acetylglutamate synthase